MRFRRTAGGRNEWLIWCKSKTNSKVWMKEETDCFSWKLKRLCKM